MAVPDPGKLFELGCQLLAAAEACLVDNGITVPDQVYITPCEPDLLCCSTLAVHPTGIDMLEENPAQRNCVVRRELTFDLWISRCVLVFSNEGKLPKLGSCADPAPGTVAGDALAILTDRWVLLQCLFSELRSLEESPWCCQPLSFVVIEPICEGNCAGTRFEITITI